MNIIIIPCVEPSYVNLCNIHHVAYFVKVIYIRNSFVHALMKKFLILLSLLQYTVTLSCTSGTPTCMPSTYWIVLSCMFPSSAIVFNRTEHHSFHPPLIFGHTYVFWTLLSYTITWKCMKSQHSCFRSCVKLYYIPGNMIFNKHLLAIFDFVLEPRHFINTNIIGSLFLNNGYPDKEWNIVSQNNNK